jgi:FKBP12-rapamycin complex-associated protein
MRTAGAPDTPSSVVAQCLISLGELARVAGEEITSEVDKILNLVIEMLSDQSSTHKRDAALKTLGQVASNTGAVITPYLDHPQLLGALFRLLRTEVSPHIRLETIRTMGMLGALDPFKHKLLQGGADDPNAETSGPRVTDITLLMNINTPSNDEYYQTVVVNSLVGVLQDTSLTSHHYAAVESVMLIFRTQRLRCVSFLPQVRR